MKVIKAISRFIGSATNLIGIFIVGMLIPNIVLAITEPYGFTTVVASLLIPTGFYIIWALISSRPGKMILWAIPIMIFCAFQLVISYLFGNSIIAIDMLTNVFTTSPSEAGELLASIYPAVILVCVIYIPIVILAIRSTVRKQTIDRLKRRNGLRVGAGIFILGCLFAFGSNIRNRDFEVKYHIFPANVLYNTKVSVDRWFMTRDYYKSSQDFRFDAYKERKDDQREVYILIIGEASRAFSWSLYGYERETTHNLENNNSVVAFKDMLTQSNTTHKSVSILLSSVSAEDYDSIYYKKSVVSLFKDAGFKTAFISNQAPNRSFVEFYGHEADELVDLTLPGKTSSDNRYDIEIIPELERLLASDKEDDLFIVIHTYGSHANHYKRYPEDFARFRPDLASSVSLNYKKEITNAYDNSIAYTDYVLSEIIETVKRTGDRAAILYSSDHGEDVMDDNRKRFLHASPTTTYYQLHIPAFAWFSDSYKEVYPEKISAAMDNTEAGATTADIFHTIADMASINSREVNSSYSLVSPQWEYRTRMYLTDYNDAVNVLNSGLTKDDIKMFDEYGLRYNPDDIKKISY